MTETERYKKRREYFRAYGKANRERRRENHRRWVAANREQYNALQRQNNRRRRLKLGATPKAENPVKAVRHAAATQRSARLDFMRARLAELRARKEASA